MRRLANSEPTLGQRLVSAGNWAHIFSSQIWTITHNCVRSPLGIKDAVGGTSPDKGAVPFSAVVSSHAPIGH